MSNIHRRFSTQLDGITLSERGEPVMLKRRSEADKDAYMAGKHLEALAEIARLKAEVARQALEIAELRTRTQPVRTTEPVRTQDRTQRQINEAERQRKRRAADKAAKASG